MITAEPAKDMSNSLKHRNVYSNNRLPAFTESKLNCIVVRRVYSTAKLTSPSGLHRSRTAKIKYTKHGNVTLLIPGHDPPLDITVFMDIAVNPGPCDSTVNLNFGGNSNGSVATSTNLHFNKMSTLTYSRSELISIRATTQCKISFAAGFQLKVNGLLRFRGKRAGKRKIPARITCRSHEYWRKRLIIHRPIPSEFINHGTVNCFTSFSSEKTTGRNLDNLITIKPFNSKSLLDNNNTGRSAAGLSIFHLNIQSLNREHLTELKEFTFSHDIDIFAISETWLKSSNTNASIAITGYRVFRLDRKGKPGGGTCIYVRNGLKVRQLKDLSNISHTEFHQQWIQIQNKKFKSIVICVAYRPPDSPVTFFDEYLAPKLNHAYTMNNDIVIIGDLNCDLIKPTSDGKRLMEFCSSFGLKQLITKPSRVTATSSTLIDVILVSNPNSVRTSDVIDLTISDHFLIFSKLNLRKPRLRPTKLKSANLSTTTQICSPKTLLRYHGILCQLMTASTIN